MCQPITIKVVTDSTHDLIHDGTTDPIHTYESSVIPHRGETIEFADDPHFWYVRQVSHGPGPLVVTLFVVDDDDRRAYDL